MKEISKKEPTGDFSDEDDRPRGPEPERLIIEEDWQEAMGKALSLRKPAGGWPKPAKSEKK